MRSRMCVVTREVISEDKLIRFVASPSGDSIVADLKCRLPGRGVWVLAQKQTVQAAFKQKKIQKGLEISPHIVIDETALIAGIEHNLQQKALQSYAMARKAGQLITGFEKVSKALGGLKLSILIEASDGAENGIKKLRARAKTLYEDDMPYIESHYNIAQLSQALGYDNLVHGGVVYGSATKMVMRAVTKRDEFMKPQNEI